MKLITLAIVAALAVGACGRFQKEAPGVSVDVVGTPGQVQGIMADQNATHVQTLGIATGTPTATATEAQQMTSGGYVYGYPYGAAGAYGYGTGATIVPSSYYMSGVATIPPLPEGGLGGVGASPLIQPIIVPIPGSASDASAVGHLINATGHLIDLADVVIAGQDYEVDLALHRICMLTWLNDLKRCPLPPKPVKLQAE